ncbi:uncharacterized protein LOC132730528 [Ruditapes philippinarum]|uniref:uncharacterized protein LOC132730528 n=1 Tax=Ruditapes philippinarum TaxID=129788 RepID=UPI00295A954D|nr:uncharacterized protein LOC132730528 [Ruditapes philippinarum]
MWGSYNSVSLWNVGGSSQVPLEFCVEDGFSLSETESYDDSVHDPDYCSETSTTDSEEDLYQDQKRKVGTETLLTCSEFIDDSQDSDTSEIIETFPQLTLKRKGPTRVKKNERQIIQEDSITSSDNLNDRSSGVKVQPVNNFNGKRKWDKVHYCLYCNNYSSTNIRKHYFGPHKEETEVQKVLHCAVGSKERKDRLEKLRNAGDYKHNTEVLRTGKGVIITWARNSEQTSAEDYLPCEYCLGFFLRSSLWRHQQTCNFNEGKKKRRKIQSEARLLLPSSIEASKGLKENVISRMAGDEITIVVRNDPLIIKLGEKLYQRHGSQRHLFAHISQKMRELGRFLISARRNDADVIHLCDIIDPRKFPLAVKATQYLCKFNEETNKYLNPSLALKIGHLLKKCAKIQRTEALIQGDLLLKEKAVNFLTICEGEWTNEISSCALQTLTDNKRNKGKMLPLSEDLSKLVSFLQKNSNLLAESLGKTFSKSNWELLNQVTLAQLVLFNRRRGGETERITVEHYKNRKNTSEKAPKEVEGSLSETEKVLLKTLCRVEIRGKRDRTVAVILTKEMQRNIDLLLRWRDEAGVVQENVYIFARSNFGSVSPIRSADVLRKFAREASLESAESITSTKLRKHIATVAQILNLSKHDLEVLANFMGHDISIHRSFYRLPQETVEVARMGRLLTAFNRGTIGQFKSIDDITLDDSEDAESDSDGNDSDEDGIDQPENVIEGALLMEEEPPIPGQNISQASETLNGVDKNRSKPKKSFKSSAQQKTKPGKIQRLTEEQTKTLRSLFQANITLRRELKRHECINVIQKYPCLKSLDWKKVKNTIHNWITLEKRKLKKV